MLLKTGIYMQSTSGKTISISMQLLMIPLTIVISLVAGFLIYKISKPILKRVPSSIGKTIIAFGLCLVMRVIEKYLHLEIFNSLLTVMIYGFFIRNYIVDSAQIILNQMNSVWKVGKLYLFAFRNSGEFHEDVCNRILNDIRSKIDPKYILIY